jgi:PKD repeat protein
MTIYATEPPSASLATLNNDLAHCPSNQVVQLSGGTYTFGGNIVIPTGVVLRGAGMSNTIIVFTSGGISVGGIGMYSALRSGNYSGGGSANWTAGYAQGTSNLTFSTTTGLTAGNYVYLDQADDTYFVNSLGYAGNMGGPRDSTHAMCQFTKVTAVNGNTVTIWPPIAATWFTGSLGPGAIWIGPSAWVSRVGIENLTVDGTLSSGIGGFASIIDMESVHDCWVKGVKSLNAPHSHVLFGYGAFRCEVRDSYFYGTQGAASTSYGVTLIWASSCLCENNVFERVVGAILPASSPSCNVYTYNFVTNEWYSLANNFLMAGIQPHQAHGYMELFEGNHIPKYNCDFLHGSHSHEALFRNRVTGWEAYSYPSGPTVNALQCEFIDITNRFMSSVGNILGTAGVYNNYISTPSASLGWNYSGVIYQIGISPGGDPYGIGTTFSNDPTTWSTFFKHMDYDVVTGGITYNPTNADVTLPNSLVYSSKPAFFGNLNWPPFNPTNGVSAASVDPTNIPAGYWRVYGHYPPTGGVINQPPIAQASAAPTNGSAPLAVSFSSAGSYDPEGVALSYSWTFGDGTTSTAANPSHTYQNPGGYSARLSVSDGTSTTASGLITINVTITGTNQPPVAVASATPAAGPAPLSVSFSSAGSYDPEGATLTYNWTFGDGSTSTAANPSHSYAVGTFSARLSVSDGTNSTSSNPMTITVTNPAPTVSMTSPANGASYAAPATINLAASVTPNGHSITKVQFYNGTALLGEDTAAPYTLSLTNMGPATYSLVAQAVYDAGATTASSAVTVTVGGLVAAYGFDERSGTTTADASVNRNNGTVSNATWTTAGQFGSALSFNGSNSVVTVSDSASLDLTQGLTLEAWVFPTALGGWRPILFKPGGTLLCYVLQGSSNPSGVPSLGLSVAYPNVMAPNPLPLNTWSHLAGTYNGVTMALYVNGVQVASQSQTGTLATSTDAVTIGGDTAGNDWSGLIDEVRVYNRALSASEIQADMNTSIGVPPPPPPTGLHIVGP